MACRCWSASCGGEADPAERLPVSGHSYGLGWSPELSQAVAAVAAALQTLARVGPWRVEPRGTLQRRMLTSLGVLQRI